jgi:hypothetical protein
VIRATAFVHLAPGAAPECAGRLIDAVRGAADELDVVMTDAGYTTPNSVGAGDVMLLGAFRDQDSYERARRDPYVEKVVQPVLEECARHIEVVRYAQGPVAVREPQITDCIQRTLLVRIAPSVDPGLVRQFEAEVAAMPRYIDAIRNSSASHVDAVEGARGPEWTHVWEQEFATLDGLTGPYMMHSYHWAFVDTWFDLQSPRQIVDPTLIHAACDLRRSILARA